MAVWKLGSNDSPPRPPTRADLSSACHSSLPGAWGRVVQLMRTTCGGDGLQESPHHNGDRPPRGVRRPWGRDPGSIRITEVGSLTRAEAPNRRPLCSAAFNSGVCPCFCLWEGDPGTGTQARGAGPVPAQMACGGHQCVPRAPSLGPFSGGLVRVVLQFAVITVFLGARDSGQGHVRADIGTCSPPSGP